MARKRTTTESSCIGIDIGTHSIKAVELVRRSDEILLRAADCINTPHNAVVDGAIQDKTAVASAIRQILRRGDFTCQEAVLAMDLRLLHMRWHHLEVEDDEVIDEIARQAAVRGLNYPPHEAVTEYRILSTLERRQRQMHHMILIAARASAIDDLLQTAERAGLEPLAVDIAPMAITRGSRGGFRASNPLWGGQPEAHCVIGCQNTLICITRGELLEFARSIPVGGDHFTQLIAKSLGDDVARAETAKCSPVARLEPNGMLMTSDEGVKLEVQCESIVDRLLREISRSLRHFQSQFPEGSYLGMIGHISLSGGGVVLRGLDKCLATRLNDEMHTVNPLAGMSVLGTRFGIERLQNAAPAFVLAMGLALGQFAQDYQTPEAKAA